MNALRRMTRFIDTYRWVLIAMLATTVVPVAMELVVPAMLQVIIDQGIRESDFGVILHGVMAMLITAAIGAAATVAQGFYRARLSQGIAYDLRDGLFRHIQSFAFADIDRIRTGELITRLSSDVDVVRNFLSAGLALILRAVLMIVGSVIMLMITDLRLSVIMFVMLAIAGIMIRSIMTIVTPLFRIVQEKLSAINTLVQENLAGVKVVKAFVRERFEIDRFGIKNIDYMEQNITVGRLLALVLPLLGIVTNLGLIAAAWWGGMDVIAGRLTVGQLVAYNNYLLIGMAPLLLLSNMLMMVSRAEASSARVFEILDTEPSLKIAPTPYVPASVQGRVVFDKVSFRYVNGENGDEPPLPSTFYTNGAGPAAALAPSTNGRENGAAQLVLDNVSFTVEKGQRVALLGATGSGKSTMVNLIGRFYDATSGAVRVDGVDVREWEPHALRSHIGMILQETMLFSGTIGENIAYGRPDASLQEVMAAATAAQAHDFIMAMADGYESKVEERGANLSGGQKQRIAIARALLVAPAILILDDSTSSVDMDTEFKIQEALETLARRSTTFVVAQRISSVLNADQILILEAGRIVARGTHHELLQSSPIYQDIYQSQLGGDSYAG
jgi:ATP-binding cassette subfamily B protein